MNIIANMQWPPSGYLRSKMKEHAAWYSGDPEILANYYSYEEPTNPDLLVTMNKDLFWGRQLRVQGEIKVHVPIAGDIAQMSSDLLFSESPLVQIKEYDKKDLNSPYKADQDLLDNMLEESAFFSRIVEAAEACAAIGGVFIKLVWDDELSEYPIPVVVQADMAIPEFKFGILDKVVFWKVLDHLTVEDSKGNKVYRLLEEYSAGKIVYTLWLGTAENLGKQMDLSIHPATNGMMETVETGTTKLAAAYIPNKLPNKLDRNSSSGCSDYLGVEGLMDSLDELFTNWAKEIAAALGKLIVPESFLEGKDRKYNKDTTTYISLNVDPVSATGNLITPQQFAIRANEFEKTALNYMERIVTSAGYSPQSFGLNIQGRAESGTALNIREGKSAYSKNKKEKYWARALKHLVACMIEMKNANLGGSFSDGVTISIEFPDTTDKTMTETASSIKMISDAMAASISTKVRMLHPDWSEQEILDEVEAIKSENAVEAVNPDALDIDQMQM